MSLLQQNEWNLRMSPEMVYQNRIVELIVVIKYNGQQHPEMESLLRYQRQQVLVFYTK